MTENHILVGLGGTGGKILKAFRKRIFQKYDSEKRAKLPIGYIYVDSSMEMMNPSDKSFRVLGQDFSFDKNSFVYIKDVNLDSIFNNLDAYPHIRGFVGRPDVMRKTIGAVGASGAAEQKRRLGRILFAASAQTYTNTLNIQFNRVRGISEIDKLTIHIFTGLAGGTGSGSIIDVVSQTRKVFQDATIVVYAMLPEQHPEGTCDSGRYHENAYAALKELNALQTLKYIPHDVTAGTGDRIVISPDARYVCNGVILYSNTNENGAVVHSFTTLPELVANFAYYRVFLNYNEKTTEEFMRSYSFENITNFDVEYNEKTKEAGSFDRVRSKRFSSFGIKRIIYPEERILDHVSYSVGKQTLLGMWYNNWSDDFGYANEATNVDYGQYVNDELRLSEFKLKDDFLTLNEPLLESDKGTWSPIKTYWDNVIPTLADVAKSKDRPLHALAAFCFERYDKNFRKVGVDRFYEMKSKALPEHAAEIARNIEGFLYNKWLEGSLSLHELAVVFGKLAEMIVEKKDMFEKATSAKQEEVNKLDHFRNANEVEWSTLSVAQRIIGRGGRLLGEQQSLMRNLMIKKTELRGLLFGVDLLSKLIFEIQGLQTDLVEFIGVIGKSVAETDKMISASKIQSKDVGTTKETVIEICENEKIDFFNKGIIRSKSSMEGITSEFRKAIVSRAESGKRRFSDIVEKLSVDEITNVFDTILRKKVEELHENVCKKESEKILGQNILQQLEKSLDTDEKLREFCTSVVEKSGVYIKTDIAELDAVVPNNDPPIKGTSINCKIVLITIPAEEVTDKIKAFAAKLKMMIENSVPSGVHVYVDMAGEDKDEVTIASIAYCFPLRIIKEISWLKGEYERMINNPNADSAREARTILHTEGDGSDIPDLFLTKAKQIGELIKECMPYFLIANAMELFNYSDIGDGSGKKAFGTIEKDDLDCEILTPYSSRFIDVPLCDQFTQKSCEEIKEKVEAGLKSKYLHITAKESLIEGVKLLLNKTILPECGGNQGSKQFLDFREYAKEALQILKQ